MDRALTLLAAMIARLPLGARDRLGASLGFVAGSLLRIRRGMVESAMARAGVRDPSSVAARMYRGLGQGICELLSVATADTSERERAVATVTIEDDAVTALQAAVTRGPVILFASHTGNWELAAAAAAHLLAKRKRKLAIVAKAMSARGVDAFLRRLRARLGVRVIAPDGAFAMVSAALREGDVVVLPIDQVPDRVEHGTSVSFLGEAALADRAPATLAWRAKATVLVVAARRVGAAHHVSLLATLQPPLEPGSGTNTARAWIESATTTATSALESFVRSSPESWLWLHRRWRAPRKGAARQTCRAPQAGLIRSHAQ